MNGRYASWLLGLSAVGVMVAASIGHWLALRHSTELRTTVKPPVTSRPEVTLTSGPAITVRESAATREEVARRLRAMAESLNAYAAEHQSYPGSPWELDAEPFTAAPESQPARPAGPASSRPKEAKP